MEQISDGVEVESLDLDPNNPRLPETIQGETQEHILAYLEENDVLDELADSYLANGFFSNEPILVLPPRDGRRIVVEGNRRVGTLMILLQLPPASSAGLQFHFEAPPLPEQLENLRRIPAFEVADRDEVSRYLGFRHISGLKTWDPEAKARYLWNQVETAAQRDSADPFYEVGRTVGSNAFGVRNSYHAYDVLRVARDDLGLVAEAQYVLREKFGVWTRLLGTANVPGYIGLRRSGSSYSDVKSRPTELNRDRLLEVLSDLRPRPGQRKAVLQDSRDATEYSDVLIDDRARAALRDYGNLQLAHQIVEQAHLFVRLSNLLDNIEVLMRDVPRMDDVSAEDAAKAAEIAALASALSAVVASKAGRS